MQTTRERGGGGGVTTQILLEGIIQASRERRCSRTRGTHGVPRIGGVGSIKRKTSGERGMRKATQGEGHGSLGTYSRASELERKTSLEHERRTKKHIKTCGGKCKRRGRKKKEGGGCC